MLLGHIYVHSNSKNTCHIREFPQFSTILPFFSGEATSGVPCLVLGFTEQESHGAPEAHPAKGYKDDWGTRSFLRGKAEVPGPVQPRKKTAERGPHQCLSVSEGSIINRMDPDSSWWC